MLIDNILKDKGGAVFTVDAETSLAEAARLLDEKRIGAAVAVNGDGSLAGVLSERDIVRRVAKHGAAALDMKVGEAMTRDVITISPKESLQDGLERMTDRRIRHLPVVEDGHLRGLVSIGDLVKWRIADAEAEAEMLKNYMAGAG